MAGSSRYARHGSVRLLVITIAITAFSLAVVLYGIPLAVLLALFASSAYCAVTYLSFTMDGEEGREAMQRAYDRIFSTIYRAKWEQRIGGGGGGGETERGGQRVKPSLACHKEAQKMIQLIMRDFVLEWYKHVTTENELPDDCRKILEHVALEINVRVKRIDLDEVMGELLTAILPYLIALNQAGKVEYNGVEIFDVCSERCLRSFQENQTVAHRALRSPESEFRYYRQLLDSVVQCALPAEYRNCDVTCLFLREVLLNNVFEPTLSLVCKPDFLNKAIPIILKKADPAEVQTVLGHVEEENKELERAQLKGRLIQAHRRPYQRFQSVSEPHPILSSKPIPVTLSRIYNEPLVGGDMGGGAMVEEGKEEGVEGEGGGGGGVGVREEFIVIERDSRKMPLKSASMEEEEIDGGHIFSPSPTSSLGSSEETPTLTRKEPFQVIKKVLRRRQTLPNMSPQQRLREQQRPMSTDSGGGGAERGGGGGGGERGGGMVGQQLDNGPEFVSVELPPVFATRYIHVRHNNSTYIGYVFKFPKTMLLPSVQAELDVGGDDSHLESVKRYSDFTRLNHQLHKTPELLHHTHKLDLPERHGFANVVSKLPFTSRDLDPAALLERKQGLERYIQLMCSKKEILESLIFQDFLKSGVRLLRKINSLQLYKSRHKRTLLGGIIAKSSSDDIEEAQALPKRPMECVLSGYLNTTLPLPCRQLNTTSITADQTLHPPPPPPPLTTGQTGTAGLSEVHRRERRGRKMKKESIVNEAKTQSDLTEKEEEEEEEEENRENEIFVAMETEEARGTGNNNTNLNNRNPSGERHTGCHGNGITTATTKQSRKVPNDHYSLLRRVREYVKILVKMIVLVVRTVIVVVYKSSQPLTHRSLSSLFALQRRTNPISNVLLSLGAEASRRHCPELWVSDTSTQLAVLTLVGGAVDRFLSRELHIVVEKEENWVRALYRLRHTLWVEGCKERDLTPAESLTATEKEERKKMASSAFKKFLPNFLPYIVGPDDYDRAVTHCIDCLQNPQINRHFFLRVIDILLPKLIPELHSDGFQKRLARLRTLTSTSHTHKLPHSRGGHPTHPKKH